MSASSALRFKSLSISRAERWLDSSERITGELVVVQAEGGKSEIKIALSEEAARRVIELCAEGFVEAAHQMAAMTIASIQREPVPAIKGEVQPALEIGRDDPSATDF